MLYACYYPQPGPDHFLEYTYDEGPIPVRNKVALVRFEHNKNYLLNMGFEFLGTIENEEELQDLLSKDKKHDIELQTRKETVPLSELFEENNNIIADEPDTAWWKNIE
jgi:hypothetical protein